MTEDQFEAVVTEVWIVFSHKEGKTEYVLKNCKNYILNMKGKAWLKHKLKHYILSF